MLDLPAHHQKMAIKPEDMLALAEELNNNVAFDNEESRRAAIGRAYYSSYHHALAICQKFALPESDLPAAGSHQRQLNRLIQCERFRTVDHWISIRTIGSMASNILNPARTKADYKLEAEVNKLETTEAIERAKFIQSKVHQVS